MIGYQQLFFVNLKFSLSVTHVSFYGASILAPPDYP